LNSKIAPASGYPGGKEEVPEAYFLVRRGADDEGNKVIGMKANGNQSLPFGFGTYYWDSRRPRHEQSPWSQPFSPTVWADFGALLTAKNQASTLLDASSRKPDTMLSRLT